MDRRTKAGIYITSVKGGGNKFIMCLAPHLKSSRAPVHKLNGPLCFDGCYGSIHILRNHVTTEKQTAGHVFTMAGVTLYLDNIEKYNLDQNCRYLNTLTHTVHYTSIFCT